MDVDVAVLGAGPAGCVAAALLAGHGRRIALIDQARFPRSKACGEGIMPSGLPVLRGLDVLPEVEQRGRRFRGVAFHSARGFRAEGLFPAGQDGLAVSRRELDAILLKAARKRPGVITLEGVRAESPEIAPDGQLIALSLLTPNGARTRLAASCVIVAEGSASRTLKALGVRRRNVRRRFGFSCHLKAPPGDSQLVEVYFFPGGEIYVADETDASLVSILVEDRLLEEFKAGAARGFFDLLARCPAASRRFEGASLQSPILGFGPLGGRSERVHGPGWLAAGDAAASVDPATGDGLALALRGGALAAAAVGDSLAKGVRFSCAARAYETELRRMLETQERRASLIVALSRHEYARELVLKGLSSRPGLLSRWLADC